MSIENATAPGEVLTIPGSENWEPGLETVFHLYKWPVLVAFFLLVLHVIDKNTRPRN